MGSIQEIKVAKKSHGQPFFISTSLKWINCLSCTSSKLFKFVNSVRKLYLWLKKSIQRLGWQRKFSISYFRGFRVMINFLNNTLKLRETTKMIFVQIFPNFRGNFRNAEHELVSVFNDHVICRKRKIFISKFTAKIQKEWNFFKNYLLLFWYVQTLLYRFEARFSNLICFMIRTHLGPW